MRSLGDVNVVAQAIQTIEGWFPGSLSYRENNPGNLTYAGQPGASPVQVCNPTCHTFAQFDSYSDGYQALVNQVNLDASRGETIAQFAAKYAPAADANDPASYAAQIATAAGLSVNDPLSAAVSSGAAIPAPPAPDTSASSTGTDLTDTTTADSTSWLDSITSSFSQLGSSVSSIDPTTLAIGAGVAGLLLVFAMRD